MVDMVRVVATCLISLGRMGVGIHGVYACTQASIPSSIDSRILRISGVVGGNESATSVDTTEVPLEDQLTPLKVMRPAVPSLRGLSGQTLVYVALHTSWEHGCTLGRTHGGGCPALL